MLHTVHSFLQLFYRFYYSSYQDYCHNKSENQRNDDDYNSHNKQDASGLHGRIEFLFRIGIYLAAKLIQRLCQGIHCRFVLIDKCCLCLCSCIICPDFQLILYLILNS